MSKRLFLFFMNPVSYGGHVTFTVHLMRALRHAGVEPYLMKCGNNTEGFMRDFGYGEQYQNVSLEDALREMQHTPTVVTAPSKPRSWEIDQFINGGARIIIHDPAEFKHGWNYTKVERPVVIRTTMLSHLPKAKFIKHPYEPMYSQWQAPTGEWNAVSTSRIDFDKHTELMLDANRLLPDDKKIQIYGFENRIYTRFNICPKYPEWKQSQVKYPKELRYATEKLCRRARFACDMSVIKGDGGGTQYTFLEAIDASCALVLNADWAVPGHNVFVNDHNCITVSNGKQLADVLKNCGAATHERISRQARLILDEHHIAVVGKEWRDELCGQH